MKTLAALLLIASTASGYEARRTYMFTDPPKEPKRETIFWVMPKHDPAIQANMATKLEDSRRYRQEKIDAALAAKKQRELDRAREQAARVSAWLTANFSTARTTTVKGHWRTSSSGKRHWVRSHTRRLP